MFIEENVKEQADFILNSPNDHIGLHLDIQFEHFAKDKVVATMPVDGRTHQPFGLLHGGASVVLAETVASVAAFLNCDPKTQFAVGVEINANHLKAVRSGNVRATATPIRIGRQIHVWNIEITNEQNQPICCSRCTLSIQNRRS